MKRILCSFFLALLLASCSRDTDNSSTVRFSLDGNGCLIQASGFDWTDESIAEDFRTVNYRWYCGEYISLLTGRAEVEKDVTLTFTGTACLQLAAEVVLPGSCEAGTTPAL
jgi:hypothetical protein